MEKGARWIFITVIAGILLFCFGIFSQYRRSTTLFEISPRVPGQAARFSRNIRCSLISNMGEDHFVEMKLAIPCRDKESWADLRGKLGKIKCDFIVMTDSEQIEGWVLNRRYNRLKEHFLRIINRHVSKPLENLYFEDLIYVTRKRL